MASEWYSQDSNAGCLQRTAMVFDSDLQKKILSLKITSMYVYIYTIAFIEKNAIV